MRRFLRFDDHLGSVGRNAIARAFVSVVGLGCAALCAGPPGHSLNLPPEFIEGVTDFTGEFRGPERDGYYQTLDFARQADPARLRAAGDGTVAQAAQRFRNDPANARRKFSLFADIVQHPAEYRGKPLTLRGYLQRLQPMDAGEDDFGLDTLHEAYLFTGETHPYVVVCTQVPHNMPIPTKGFPTNDVVVSGYFFKLWSYEAERGRWAAPVILASRIDWEPRSPSLLARQEFQWSLGLGFAALVLGLAGMLARQRRNDRRLRAARETAQQSLAARDLAALAERDNST
ncbi:MAG: hypothetical protein ACT4QC_14425 [Planctomycetaceae bacterium]